MGATERRALDDLARLGAEIRVSYDAARTRLHAKAWLFHRDTGFSTACVGSSNLSAAAMLDGLEWNVRLSRIDNGAILDKFQATFEQYWDDPAFRPYDPARDAESYDRALRRERRGEAPTVAGLFDIRPRPHQQEILDDLAAERARGHVRNLVVAATGTGKTIAAAFDYARLRRQWGTASLLFVAHRREILEQSLAMFRGVLGEGAFGELLHAGESPKSGRHVFASIQSLSSARLERMAPEAYDVVIVDEFHHAAAPTYERLLGHVRPRVLVGLTATPERADGQSILGYFDGRIATELRLWKALDQGLLSPFQYFGVAGPDLSGVKWVRGRYDVEALRRVYTAHDWIARHAVREVREKVSDVEGMRALAFCVDVAHAELMAAKFCEAGIRAVAVSGRSGSDARRQALEQLRAGELQIVFSVDLFNEGVDLPDVDTLLFLRPTESAPLFLQQLGRGLRVRADKECCTVLDFIGNAHRKFRFDARFRGIVGGTRKSLVRDIERGFPKLPSGCAIKLDRVAREAVLANVRSSLAAGYAGLAQDLQAMAAEREEPVRLRELLDEAGAELEDVYAGSGRCWTDLRRRAGLPVGDAGPEDRQLQSALSRMLHVDDEARLGALRRLLERDRPPRADDRDPAQRMLFVLLGYIGRPYATMQAAWDGLWESPVRAELVELVEVLEDRSRTVTTPLSGALAGLPLRVHATYTLDEVMAAVDERTKKDGVKRIQTGVYYVARLRTDLLFVTLEKSQRDYSPTTLYNDYPISERRFHWESQSNCHEDTKTGQRYLSARRGADQHVLLFVRQRRKDSRGQTMPYCLLGPAYYGTHRGGRPMQVEWELDRPMPARLYQEVKVAAG
jgi:superfamily II DNA or RNA helicase